MIENDILDIFTENYKRAQSQGHDLIVDNYRLKDAIYIIIDKDTFEPIDTVKLRYKKGEMVLEEGSEEYLPFLCYADYYSKLEGGTNRAICSKTILSNNRFSFCISDIKLKGSAKTPPIGFSVMDVEDYFDQLAQLETKYANTPKNKIIYDLIKKDLPDIDVDDINRFKSWVIGWILENGGTDENIITKNPGYKRVRIFRYDKDTYKADFKNEAMRQIKQCLFSKNEYNQEVNGEILGLPSFGINANSNKPFIMNQNRKCKVPTLITLDMAWKEKQLADYLTLQGQHHCNNIYFPYDTEKDILAIDDYTEPPTEFRGIYLRITLDMDVPYIEDCSIINFNNTKPLELEIIPRLTENLKDIIDENIYRPIPTMLELEAVISKVFFKNCLRGTYHRDSKMMPSVVKNDAKVQLRVNTYKDLMYEWFHEGGDGLDGFKKMADSAIYSSLGNPNIYQIVHQYDVKEAVIEYFREENLPMVEDLSDLVFTKISVSGMRIDTDEEYYYSVGTLLAYIVSKQQTKEKQPLVTLNAFLQPQKNKALNEKMNAFILRNAHTLDDRYGKKPKRMYEMVLKYNMEVDADKPVNRDLILMGVLAENPIYRKKIGVIDAQ